MSWEFNDFSNIVTDIKSKNFYKTKVVVLSVVTVFLILLTLLSLTKGFTPRVSFSHNNATITVSDYKRFDEIVMSQVSEKYNNAIVLYDSSGLSVEEIERRNGAVIVERCICYVNTFDNGEGSGTILNAFDKDFSYIHFSDMGEEIHKGTIVVSYLVYNPDNNYVDDVSDIYDFVLSREYEIK